MLAVLSILVAPDNVNICKLQSRLVVFGLRHNSWCGMLMLMAIVHGGDSFAAIRRLRQRGVDAGGLLLLQVDRCWRQWLKLWRKQQWCWSVWHRSTRRALTAEQVHGAQLSRLMFSCVLIKWVEPSWSCPTRANTYSAGTAKIYFAISSAMDIIGTAHATSGLHPRIRIHLHW